MGFPQYAAKLASLNASDTVYKKERQNFQNEKKTDTYSSWGM